MTKSANSEAPAKRTYRVLTTVEKLDGQFPGLATETRIMLDKKVSAAKIARILCSHFPVRVTADHVSYFRTTRWSPQKQVSEAKSATIDTAIDLAKRGCDLELVAAARIRELIDKSTIRDATVVRLCEIKIRDQELKELAFELKASRLMHDDEESEKESDPAAEETKTKRVMNKIRGIFGLDPLPEDEGGQDRIAEDQATEDEAAESLECAEVEEDPVGAASENEG